MIVDTEADVAVSTVPAYIVGHVGDGNFHCVFKLKADDPAEVAEVARLNARIVERAIAAGGTSTGEHGVGLGKRAYLEAEHGRDAVAVMALLKKALDPDNILNPGKVLPDDIAAAAGLPLPFA